MRSDVSIVASALANFNHFSNKGFRFFRLTVNLRSLIVRHASMLEVSDVLPFPVFLQEIPHARYIKAGLHHPCVRESEGYYQLLLTSATFKPRGLAFVYQSH
jgi:hypothetical protein